MNFQFLILKRKRRCSFAATWDSERSEEGSHWSPLQRATSFLGMLILFFTIVSTISAQTVSLAISPPLLEVFIKPGKSIMVAYKVENLGDPTIMKAKVLPFEPKDTLGNIRIKEEFEGPIRFSLDNADLALDQPFFMKTRGSQQLLLRIRVPDGAPSGDYYYSLLVETAASPGSEGVGSARAKATIGGNILITVTESGMVDIKGKVALFDVLPRWKLEIGNWKFRLFDSNDPIPVVLIVDNKGKNLIKPQGEIVLKGNFGEKAKYEILPQNILAESQRLLTATPSADIDYPRPTSLVISGFFVGLYRLSTTINFGENSPNVFAAAGFIAIPIKLIIGLLITLFIGVLVIKKIRKTAESK